MQQPDAYHRRGFDVRYRYPGEGAAPLRALIEALAASVGDRPYDLLVEGLDSRAEVDDQVERLRPAMAVVRSLLHAGGRVRAVVFTGAGGNEVVQVVQRDDPTMADDEVLVDVPVAGLNPADLQQREGRYPAPAGVVPDVPGLEVAGSVVDVGAAVTRWSPGDRVFGLVAGGGLASRVSVHEQSVTRVPEHLDDRRGRRHPGGLHHRPRRAHDPGSDASRRDRAGAWCLRSGGMRRPPDRAWTGCRGHGRGSQRTGGRARALTRRRAGRCCDVRSRSCSSAPTAAAWTWCSSWSARPTSTAISTCSRLRGRIVVVSVATGSSAQVDLLRLMVRRATIRGTVLRARPLDEKAAAVEAFTREAVPLLEDGRARPIVDSVFAVDDVADAFDRLAEPGKEGKCW